MIRVQSATVTRNYRNNEVATKRITLTGNNAVGDVLPTDHVWSGWRITELVECGSIASPRGVTLSELVAAGA